MGRAPWPSGKKSLAASVFTLGWLCMFCRQPAASKSRAAITRRPERRGRALRVSALNFEHLARLEAGQEALGAGAVELRVPRLDDQEVAVARGQCEARHVEYGVVRVRQAVQREHAQH